MENGKKHLILSNLNCNSNFVIYCIVCNCSRTYIGETHDFRGRTNLHKDQVRNKDYRSYYLPQHLFNCGDVWKIMPIFRMSSEDLIERKQKEIQLIDKYEHSLKDSCPREAIF